MVSPQLPFGQIRPKAGLTLQVVTDFFDLLQDNLLSFHLLAPEGFNGGKARLQALY